MAQNTLLAGINFCCSVSCSCWLVFTLRFWREYWTSLLKCYESSGLWACSGPWILAIRAPFKGQVAFNLLRNVWEVWQNTRLTCQASNTCLH